MGLGNPNGAAIRKETERVSKQQRAPLTHGVFGFGNVDVHMNYYYQKYEKAHPIDFAAIANVLVAFVAGLAHVKKKTVLGVYADSLKDEAVCASLRRNGTLSEDAKEVSDWDVRLQCRQQRVLHFNACLAKACARYQGVKYLDVFDEMVHPQTYALRDNFLSDNASDCDVRWQPTLLLWIHKMPWLKEIVDQDFLARLANADNVNHRREQPAQSVPLVQRADEDGPTESVNTNEGEQLATVQDERESRSTDRDHRGDSGARSHSEDTAEDDGDTDEDGEGEYTL